MLGHSVASTKLVSQEMVTQFGFLSKKAKFTTPMWLWRSEILV